MDNPLSSAELPTSLPPHKGRIDLSQKPPGLPQNHEAWQWSIVATIPGAFTSGVETSLLVKEIDSDLIDGQLSGLHRDTRQFLIARLPRMLSSMFDNTALLTAITLTRRRFAHNWHNYTDRQQHIINILPSDGSEWPANGNWARKLGKWEPILPFETKDLEGTPWHHDKRFTELRLITVHRVFKKQHRATERRVVLAGRDTAPGEVSTAQNPLLARDNHIRQNIVDAPMLSFWKVTQQHQVNVFGIEIHPETGRIAGFRFAERDWHLHLYASSDNARSLQAALNGTPWPMVPS